MSPARLFFTPRGNDADARAGSREIMLYLEPVNYIGAFLHAGIIFQFVHEYAHALSEYYVIRGSASTWFNEAICDNASLYVLRKLDSMIQTDEIELIVRAKGLS